MKHFILFFAMLLLALTTAQATETVVIPKNKTASYSITEDAIAAGETTIEVENEEPYFMAEDSYLLVTAPKGYTMTVSGYVKLYVWSSAEGTDYLNIYDGGDTSAPRLGQFWNCSNSEKWNYTGYYYNHWGDRRPYPLPVSVKSTGNQLYFYFHCDQSGYVNEMNEEEALKYGINGVHLTVTVEDSRKSVDALAITIPAQTYTGSALTPVVTVEDGGTALTSGTDYTVTLPSDDCIDAGNYDITIIGTGDHYKGVATRTFSIDPKAVSVTAADKSKTYGETDPELTATVEGVVDDAEIVYAIGRAEGENAGVYAITPSGEAVQGNYAVTYVGGNLTIGKATPTIAIENQTIRCNQTLADVTLPTGYSFVDASMELAIGDNAVGISYNPDAENYETVEGSMTITVEHSFTNYVYNDDATTEADGTETAVCDHGCGATDTRTAEGTMLPTVVTSLDDIIQEADRPHAKKYISNGRLIIEVGGLKYDLTGVRVK